LVCTIDVASGQAMANVLRQRAGGNIPHVSIDDPVLAPLLHIAVDGFPSLLLTNRQLQNAGLGMSMAGASTSDATQSVDIVFQIHPRRDETIAAISGDPDLSTFFAQEADGELRGRVGDATNMASALLQAAALRLLAGRDEPRASGLVQEVTRQVEDSRRLARGETVSGAVLAGLSGIRLSDEVGDAELPWGTLREARARLRMIGRQPLPFGEQTATAVLEIPKAIDPGNFSVSADVECARSAVRLLGLGALMAEGRAGSPVPLVAWITRLGALQDGSSSSSAIPLRFPQPEGTALDRDRVQAVREWCERIDALDPELLARIDIAIDRIIASVSEHADAGDGLIDAVMVWENLFGSKQETTFKVTAALTVLTVRDPAQRKRRFAELQSAYNKRSELVHGQPVSTAELHAARATAIDAGLAALRVLLDKRTDLLARRKRAEAVILGVPQGS